MNITMSKITICVFLAFSLPLGLANVEVDQSVPSPVPKNRAGKAVFSYGSDDHGPKHWSELSPKFDVCNHGHAQSPVNILVDRSFANTTSAPSVKLEEAVVNYHVTGNNFQFDCMKKFHNCSTIHYKGNEYSMIQTHIHSPSEHHLGGKAYPMEVHFVHQAADKSLLVLGVFFEVGSFNYEFQKFLDAADDRSARVIDLSKLWMEDSSLCAYKGSLTTPPCTEDVQWLVSTGALKASLRQIGTYREMVGERKNNRPIQALEKRTIVCYPSPRERKELHFEL